MIIFLFVSIIIVLSLYLSYKKHFNYWIQYKNVVASAPGRMFSGNLLDFLTFKTNFGYHLKTIYEDPQFASQPVVGIYGFYKPSLLIRDPELIKSVLIKDFDCFCDRFAEGDVHHDPVGGNMMFFVRYNVWKDIRSKLTPIFSSGKLKFMYPLVQKVGEDMEDYLKKLPDVNRLEMKNFCGRYTIDTIATTLFGFSTNSFKNPDENVILHVRKLSLINWRRALDNLVIFFMPKLCTVVRPKFLFRETEKFLTYTFNYMMSERERTGEKRNDLIDIFVKLQQDAIKSGDDVVRLRELMLAQLGMFLAAGYDTSSTTISNALFELAKNTQIQQKLRQEISEAFAAGEGAVPYEALINMEYLNMVIYETLRLYPVLPFLDRKYCDPSGRGRPYDLKPFCDFNIPDGMPVYISTYGLNSDPKYWPDPAKFEPERFSAESKESRHPMVSLPFGNGPHNCIGLRLGLMQVKVGLLYLLRNHHVQVCDETLLQPEMDAKAFVLQIRGGIQLEIRRDNMCDDVML